MSNETQPIVIFTDGACTGNPGPGGWGCIIAGADPAIREMGGSAPETTNNRMEMAAAIRALGQLEPPVADIVLYTDSTYLIKGITQWVWGWRSRGWKTAEGKDVANKEMWEELVRQVTRLKPAKIDWRYVRGHVGYPGNERCDEIAVAFAKGKKEPLYIGTLDGYFVDLSIRPDAEPLPEQKNGSKTSGTKGGGASGGGKPEAGYPKYISYVNGVLKGYATWSPCERDTKGKPGAKFKKVSSLAEQKETLVKWGLDPNSSC
jgi:ribonuclease HI